MKTFLQTDCVAELNKKYYNADLFFNNITKKYEVRLMGQTSDTNAQIYLASKLHKTVNFNLIEEYRAIHFEPLFMGHIQFEMGHMIPLEYICRRNNKTRPEISDHIELS